MQRNWYEYLKKIITEEPDVNLLLPVRRAFFTGQVKFARIAELITEEQFVELESLVVRMVLRYGVEKEEDD